MKLFRSFRQPAGADADLHVLMVCMGNICRSPTAEVVLRERLRRAGLQGRVQVGSAGTHADHRAEPPDARAIRHAALRGYELAALRARPVEDADFRRSHWILAMDEVNLRCLHQRRPDDSTAQIDLLRRFARRHTEEREVPDPYYGGPGGFERVLDLVEDACDGLVEHLAMALASAKPRDGKA